MNQTKGSQAIDKPRKEYLFNLYFKKNLHILYYCKNNNMVIEETRKKLKYLETEM